LGPATVDFAPASFSTENLRPVDRLSYYREVFVRSVGAKCEIDALDERFRCDVSLNALPGASIARIAASPVRVSVSRQMAANVADNFLFMLYRRGACSISQLGREIAVNGASAVLMSSSDPMTLQRSFSRFTAITVPRLALAPLLANVDAAMMSVIPPNLEAMRLLTGYLHLLAKGPPFMTPETRRVAAAHVHDLMAVALGATRDVAEAAKGRGVGAARLTALKSDIMVHLARPDLEIGAVASRQGISESYIRKLFEGEGTSFSDFVLSQRLARAHRMLTDARFAGRSIISIAFDAGFGDLSYFNRCFRRRFGDTPSAIRASAANGTGELR
jgi:AraC-like DNA-binding protein